MSIIISEILFWLSIGLLLYTYIVFGTFLALLAKITRRKEICNKQTEYKPNISIIVAAYNEEKSIRQCIENLLEMNYPKDKLEIIIASDGSTDNTALIAKAYKDNNLIV